MEATKVYPSPEELAKINSNIPCTEKGCEIIFKSESNLNLHLTKTHKKQFEIINSNKEYYCPRENCIYNEDRFFKSLKLLKQHFLKVHAEKLYKCKHCDKGFATLKYRENHEEYCGVEFKCCNCEVSYPSYESLLTHGRRKGHKILEKSAYNFHLSTIDKTKSESKVKVVKKNNIFILPKASTSLQYVNLIPIVAKSVLANTSDKSSQTENSRFPKLKSRHTQVVKESINQNSKHSQTSLKSFWSSVETQTIGDYLPKKLKLSDSNFIKCSTTDSNINLKSTKTQTQLIASSTKSCNTSFELIESDYNLAKLQRSSSSTQTLPSETIYSASTATHDSIHTDTSDLTFECIHSSSQTSFSDNMSIFDSSNYFNCDIETQTDFMLNGGILNYNCIADTHTQTVNLKNDLELENTCEKNFEDLFNTIDTQTMFDDVARSVESQTTMCLNKINSYMSCRDMANMETQTETDFKLLLEEINA